MPSYRHQVNSSPLSSPRLPVSIACTFQYSHPRSPLDFNFRRSLGPMLGMDMSYQTLGGSELRMVLGWIGHMGQARCVVVIQFSHAWPSAGEPGRQW